MAEFQFKSGVKTLDIKNPSGEVVKTFTINVGEKEQTKKWMAELEKVQKISANLSGDSSVLDELEVIEKSVVESILGVYSWEFLWELCGKNVLSMLGFLKYLSEFLSECMNDFYKDYV